MEDIDVPSKFIRKEFNMDDFLNEACGSKDLTAVINQLNLWRTRNTDKMYNVLREQTDSVVYIAEEVQGLNSKIGGIETPVAQLWEETNMIKARVRDYHDKFVNELDFQMKVFKRLVCELHIKMYRETAERTQQLLDDYIEDGQQQYDNFMRICVSYALQKQVIGKLSLKHDGTTVERKIVNELRLFLIEAYNNRDKNAIYDVTETFSLLNMDDKVVEIIQEDIVRPSLEPILNEQYLSTKASSLEELYDDTITKINSQLPVLVGCDRKFDLVIDCYWPVIDDLLRSNLTSITAAGHAKDFYDNFSTTCKFLNKIGDLINYPDIIYEHAGFIAHLKRFNLLVYYEIRHQEISSTMESSIYRHGDFINDFFTKVQNVEYLPYELHCSCTYYLLIQYIFDDKNIFLPFISDQFLKSALLISNRYLSWTDDIIDKCKSDEVLHLRTLKSLLHDYSIIISLLGFPADSTMKFENCPLSHLLPTSKETLYSLVEYILEKFTPKLNKIKDLVKCICVNQVIEEFKSVGSIPRLYRRTNKMAPKEPSSYMNDALTHLRQFAQLLNCKYNKEVNDQYNSVFVIIIQECITVYLKAVKEVVTSVEKTESSLRRLKNRSGASKDDNRVDTNSDDYKIRLQLKLDLQRIAADITLYKIKGTEDDIKSIHDMIEEILKS